MLRHESIVLYTSRQKSLAAFWISSIFRKYPGSVGPISYDVQGNRVIQPCYFLILEDRRVG